MSLSVIIDGDAIDEGIPPASISAQSIAKDGNVGFGSLAIEDPTGVLNTVGHKRITIEETACSQPRLFTGFVTERNIGRSADDGLIVDDARQHGPTIVDLNAAASFRIITYATGKRPEETMGARLTWLLGHQSFVNLAADTGFVTYYDLGCDAADFTGGTPKAVLDDLAGRKPGITWFLFWDTVASEVGLYFGPDSTGISESSLSISNDIADINPATGVYPPDSEAKLRRTPEEVYSEVMVTYGDQSKMTYRKRGSISTAYIARGTTISRPYTQRESTAQAQAEAFLDNHAEETDTITTTILVFPEDAGLVTAGQRIDVKFTHLPDYTTWTSMRVVSVNVRPANDVANRYYLDLELEKPKAGTAPQVVGVVQLAVDEDSGFGPRVTFTDFPAADHTFVGVSAQRAENAIWDVGDGYVPVAHNPALPAPSYVVGTEWTALAAIAVRGGDDYPITIAEKYPTDATDALYKAWEWQNGGSGGKRAYHVEVAGIGSATQYGASLFTVINTGVGIVLEGNDVTVSTPGILFIGGSYTASGPADGSSPSMYGLISGLGDILDQGYVGTDPVDGFAPFTWFAQLDITAAGSYSVDYYIDVIPRNPLRNAGYVWAFYPTTEELDETEGSVATPGSTVHAAPVTPVPDGTQVEFTTTGSYSQGSLVVFVAGVAVPRGYVYETNPSAGTFELAWAPDADETIFSMFIAGV